MITPAIQAIFNVSTKSATLIGAGGIGAITAVTLGKMGIGGLRIFDDDIVDPINLATQFHAVSDVGAYKSLAVDRKIHEFCGNDTEVFNETYRVERDADLRDWVVISAVDSISARKSIWEAVLSSEPMWYLDARMSAEVFHLYTVRIGDTQSVDFYQKVIDAFDERDVQEVPCTQKATIFCACVAAGLIGKTVRQIATGIVPPRYVIHNIIEDVITVIR